MSEDYIKEVKKMGDELEVVLQRVVKLESLLLSNGAIIASINVRIDDLEHRNKKVEKECNSMIVKYYEQDVAKGEEPAWEDV